MRDPVVIRRSIGWIWAPALAAAALAFFIGRDIYLNRQTPALTDRDVPVAIGQTQKAAPPANATIAAPPSDRADMQRAQVQPTVRQATTNAAGRRNTGGTNAAAVPAPATPLPGSEAPANEEARNAPGMTAQAPQNELVAASKSAPTETQPTSAADTKVWPDRRVTKMGAIASDTEKNARKDERGLPGQGPHSLSERGYVDGAPGAETVHTYHSLERLEAPQLRAAPGFPDSQSPAEAMRRLDQLGELRKQIATLEAINPSERTAEQNRELCTLWYRVGALATTRPLLDSALQQLGTCLQATSQSESQEWQTKTTQLTEKRSTLPK